MQLRVIIFLISALLVALFAVVNIQPVTINFLLAEAEIQLIFVIIFSILIGAILMFILSSMKQIKMTKQIKALEKENLLLKDQQKELSDLDPSVQHSTVDTKDNKENKPEENPNTEIKNQNEKNLEANQQS